MHMITPSSFFTRPANTTAYTIADLVADTVTAGSVAPLKFSVMGVGRSGLIRRARIHKGASSATNASFSLHLFDELPTVAGGDNAALSVSANTASYLGSIALDMTSGGIVDAAAGLAQISAAAAIGFSKPASGSIVYGLLEALAAYTPASAEIFTVTLEIEG